MKTKSDIPVNLSICNSSIVEHNISILRDKNTTPEHFRTAVKRISQTLINRAFENVPLTAKKIETPLMETEVNVIDSNAEFIIAPILRAGLIFSEVALDILPHAKVHHIGLYRDEATLKPVSYYNNLPERFLNASGTYVYVFDPMLATGGSAIAAIKLFIDLDIPQENITFISLISAPEGAAKLASNFGNIKMITGAMDSCLNNVGYILPGLGDAGDRTFNTVKF